jgi:hypothetical protein
MHAAVSGGIMCCDRSHMPLSLAAAAAAAASLQQGVAAADRLSALAAAVSPPGCLSPALLLPSLCSCQQQPRAASFWASCCCCGETDRAAAACAGGRTGTYSRGRWQLPCEQPSCCDPAAMCVTLPNNRCFSCLCACAVLRAIYSVVHQTPHTHLSGDI